MKLSVNNIQVLESIGVKAIVLFGSRALGTARETSDYDIFVIGSNKKEIYDTVYDVIADAINVLTNIDIVFDSDAPLELKHHVASYGQVIYQENTSLFADFREKVMREYADFALHRAIFSNATLSRVQL